MKKKPIYLEEHSSCKTKDFEGFCSSNSKLFKTFVREYNPDSVFSYCDFNKFDGRGYEALGMQFVGYTGPDKFYVDKSEHKVNRNPKKRKQLEESCMFTIWGSGSKKYLWKKNA